MAVQKSKVTRSTRGQRRSHDALKASTAISEDPTSGELHRRHHVTEDGFYRGKSVVDIKTKKIESEDVPEEAAS